MPMIVLGLIEAILIMLPYFYFNKNFKRLTKVSFICIAFLLLPPFVLRQSMFGLGNMDVLTNYISFSNSFSLGTVALLPLALKSTILLWGHEIRLFDFNRNIFLFLFVSLIQPFIQVFFLGVNFVKSILAYF